MIYCYNVTTGEYSMAMPFETKEGEGRTTIAPPETGDNEAAVFDTDTQEWSVYPDYRFTHKMLKDNTVYNIEDLGEIPDGYELITNEEADKIEGQNRIANLSLTAADVERAIYKVKGIDFDDIVEIVEELNEAEVADIDIKALKIELKANYFYRGNDYVDKIGTILGFTSAQLDNFFETGDYTCLDISETEESTETE